MAVKLLKDRGQNAKIGYGKYKNPDPTVPASYGGGTVAVNPIANVWYDPEGHMRRSKDSGEISSSHPLHVVHHEIGHGLYRTKMTRFSPGEQGLVRKQVSTYAGKNPNEFLAEVHAGIEGGEKFSPEIMEMFRRYAGVSHKSEQP